MIMKGIENCSELLSWLSFWVGSFFYSTTVLAWLAPSKLIWPEQTLEMGVSKASVVGGYKFGKMSIYIIQVLILAVIRCDGIRLAFRNLHLKAIQPQKDVHSFRLF